ncbi:hypothetical protein LCGC14_0461500 [marine sediment metagenome]|uniref:Uncharacterized protein n=1 Tax=marine sediment metagenome TaxID=412755 RepID=A0A0F9SXQ7_9ZZZZ
MPEPHVFRLQLIATPGEQEGDLEAVLLVELPPGEFDPLDYLAFLHAGQNKTGALFEEELGRVATTYAELQGLTVEQARIELLDVVCNEAGLALGAGGKEEQRIILAD